MKPYNPSEEEQSYIQALYKKFDDSKQQRQNAYPWLSRRSIEQYWKDSEKRWLALPYDGSAKAWWQSTASKPITRQKITAIVAHVVDFYLKPTVRARGKSPARALIAQGLQNILEVADSRSKQQRVLMSLVMDAAIYGTAYAQED